MLELIIPRQEGAWNSRTKEFGDSFKGATIKLEHSLLSISKWESIHHKPFLECKDMTMDELVDYIKCMTITQSVPEEVYKNLTKENYEQVKDYIIDPSTATWFNEQTPEGVAKNSKKQIVTSELIYYWMIAQNIPFECEKWHLNRLMTLIKVCSLKNAEAQEGGPKKMSRKDLLNSNRALNEARRKKLRTKG